MFQFPAGRDPNQFEFEFDSTTQQGSYVIRDALGTSSRPRHGCWRSRPPPWCPDPRRSNGRCSDSGLFLYSTVAFNEPISPSAPVASTLGIKPLGQSTLRLLSVVDCAPPAPVAVIDAQPGLSSNPVNPASTKPTLVIRFRKGLTWMSPRSPPPRSGASPVTSGLFGRLSRPHDVNGDGRKDRLYFFRPSQTGLTCASRSVTIGGTLTVEGHGPAPTRSSRSAALEPAPFTDGEPRTALIVTGRDGRSTARMFLAVDPGVDSVFALALLALQAERCAGEWVAGAQVLDIARRLGVTLEEN